MVDARAFTLDFLEGLSTVDQEEMAELLTAAIENVDGDHWVGFPMTLLEGGNHSFCTDTTQNQMAFDQDDCDLKDPKFFESGARQRFHSA